ncbi:MAG: RluA family pseudouridine synthase [Dehalococcoidales bacterium]|nr:MAG: RluA family pseudouridine synthase [Dehalococcoidales bacterium]
MLVDRPGIRLDKYVSEQNPELTRTQAQKLIHDGHITVNDCLVKASHILNTGDRLTISLPSAEPASLLPEDIPLNIVYEDTDLLVVDKPAGLAVHPAPGHAAHTLVNATLSHLAEFPDTGDWQRPGIVHRLDKDTSGLMVVAKNNNAQLDLAGQFQDRSVKKVYMALVKGNLTPQDGVIEAPIGRDRSHRERMAVVTEDKGREARTRFHVVRYISDYSLLEIRPETGRTHQIRVHLAAIGYPVVGDKVYGVKSPYLERQFLHASRLGFRLPSTGEYIEFTSELPADLEQALKVIGQNL